MATVGLLHPGEMGAAVGGCLVTAGHTVLWDPAGRSRATTGRALAAELTGTSLDSVVSRSSVIFSVCPPHAALDVARQVAATGFGGVYVDANAISVATAARVATVVTAAGAVYVDGGIIGPPPDNTGHTRLYLCGERAAEVRALFTRSALEARIAEGAHGEPYAASAVKMAYAAWTKGTGALLLACRALARAEGVERTSPRCGRNRSGPPTRRRRRAGDGWLRWRRSPRRWPPPGCRRNSTRPPPRSSTGPRTPTNRAQAWRRAPAWTPSYPR